MGYVISESEKKLIEKKYDLYKYVENQGYNISRGTGSVSHKSKIVYLDYQDYDTLTNVYTIAHEVGHIFQHKRRKLLFKDPFKREAYKRSKKYLLLLDEFEAWIFGFFILIRFSLPLKQYPIFAWKCFKTYIKYCKNFNENQANKKLNKLI